MAALIPLLASFLPQVLEKAPSIIGGIAGAVEKIAGAVGGVNRDDKEKEELRRTVKDLEEKNQINDRKMYVRTVRGPKRYVRKYGIKRTNALNQDLDPRGRLR